MNPSIEPNQPETKMKTSSLCKSIFEIISNCDVISDQELMGALTQIYGNEKIENIKRRKYDIINILENSKIIRMQKNERGEARYSIGQYYIPNYEQKMKEMGEELDQAKQRMEEKRQELQRLERVRMNFAALTQKNSSQTSNQTPKIQYPFHFIEGNLLHVESQSSENKLSVELDKGSTVRNVLGEKNSLTKMMDQE